MAESRSTTTQLVFTPLLLGLPPGLLGKANDTLGGKLKQDDLNERNIMLLCAILYG